MSKGATSPQEIADSVAMSLHYQLDEKQREALRGRVRRAKDKWVEYGEQCEEDVDDISTTTYEAVAEQIQKKEVVQNFEPCVKEVNWKGNRIIRFGLMGDTQINSKYTQLTYLHQYYDECQRQGITHVYHTGDIDEGDQMRMGHQYECYNQGADEHVAEIVRVYPRRDGIMTHFITGNHDSSITRRSGHDIGKAIAAKRGDLEYLGADCAVVYLTPNCIMQLQHPWDGTAYALSYKLQKMIDGMQADMKPNIFAVGHYHKIEYLFYRNVHAFQTGCFQSQTPFTMGKGISVHMGGWIVEIHVDELGHIEKIIPQLIPFYRPIKADYENWRGA